MDEFNTELCTERHEYIEKSFDSFDKRLKKVENRFLALITLLIGNLIGVIAVLGVLLIKFNKIPLPPSLP